MITLVCLLLACAFQWLTWVTVLQSHFLQRDSRARAFAVARFAGYSALSIGFAALGGYSL